MKAIIQITFFFCFCLMLPLVVDAQSIGNMYDYSTLQSLKGEYAATLEKFMKNKLPRYLTAEQQRKLSNVQIDFPLRGNGSYADPFCYYAYASSRSITISIQSLKFLEDLCLAFAWLSNNNYSIETVTDYVAMIRYKKPNEFSGGRYPRPLDALGIPAGAKRDPATRDLALALFLSGQVFILCHELGHIYYQHPGNLGGSKTESRYNEANADRFSLSIMKEIPVLPMGALLYFQLYSHWDWDREETTSTHPLNANRLMNIGDYLMANASSYARDLDTRVVSSVEKAKVHSLAKGFKSLAALLSKKELQQSILLAARDRDPSTLKPRKNGGLQAMPKTPEGSFSGYYQGSFIKYDIHGVKEPPLTVVVHLQARGEIITGQFNFGLGDGLITNGWRKGNTLYFNWRWGGAYGSGVLNLSNEGKKLSGTWGYNVRGKSYNSGGGEWLLYPY